MLNGVTFGSVLFLLASGLSLIFGVMGILNLAHGALFMVGAYVGWSIAVAYDLNYTLAIIGGALAAGVIGLVMERVFLRRLRNQINEQVLLTFGFVYILTNISLWIWGSSPKPAFTADFLSFSVNIGGGSYPIARIAIIGIGIILAALLWWLQNKTRIGAIVRASMDDSEMTSGLGINLELTAVAVFFLGAFIAGFAGVVGAQILGANLQLSISILLLALVVVVVGGMGSVEGALVGAILIGIIDTLGKSYFPQFAMFTIYLAMVIILLIRPSGLLPGR